MLPQIPHLHPGIPLYHFGAHAGGVGLGSLPDHDDAFRIGVPGDVADGSREGGGEFEFAKVEGVVVGPDAEFAACVARCDVAAGGGEFGAGYLGCVAAVYEGF